MVHKPDARSLPVWFSLCALAGLWSGFAQAQTPADAGSILNQQRQLGPQLPAPAPEAQPAESGRPAVREVMGPAVLVKTVRFTGAVHLVPEAELQALVQDIIGKKLDFAALQKVADRISEHLRSRGFLLARAYLPRQDVTDGAIEISLIEGLLEGTSGAGGGWHFLPSDKTRIDRKRMEGIAEAQAPSGAAVQGGSLERALLLMNDLPGVTARSRLEPGAAPGTTRVMVETSEGPLVAGTAWADNHGNRSTGTGQISANLNINDPTGQGDLAQLLATVTEGVQLARLGYDRPLGYQGLRANISYTDMRYQITEGSGVAAGLKGESQSVNAGLSYPFVRSRLHNLYGTLSYAHKALTDNSSAGTVRDKRVDALTLALSGNALDQWQGGGLNAWSLALVSGDLDLSRAPADKASDAATLRTDGRYTKLLYNASRLQRLGNDFTLSANLSGQKANGNLDSSEKIILGGPTGVRAYPVGEASGDEGWLANIEFRYEHPSPTPWGALQLTAFADAGSVRLYDTPDIAISTATGRNSYLLKGAGLAAGLGKIGNYHLRLTWAHALGDNPGRDVSGHDADGRSDANRFWLQATFWF